MDTPVQAYVPMDKHSQSYVTPDPEYFQIHIQLRFYLLICKLHSLLGTLQQGPFYKHPPITEDEKSLETQRKKTQLENGHFWNRVRGKTLNLYSKNQSSRNPQ